MIRQYIIQELEKKNSSDPYFLNIFFILLKLDVDGEIDSIHLFLSPRQVHLLLDMLAAIAGPGEPNLHCLVWLERV